MRKTRYLISTRHHPHIKGMAYYTGDLWTTIRSKAFLFSNKSMARNKAQDLSGLISVTVQPVQRTIPTRKELV